jgi:hypothetical protein
MFCCQQGETIQVSPGLCGGTAHGTNQHDKKLEEFAVKP